MTDFNITEYDPEGSLDSWFTAEVGGKLLIISEKDENHAHIYIADHGTIEIEGEWKDEVQITVAKDEFPTKIRTMTEKEHSEEYYE